MRFERYGTVAIALTLALAVSIVTGRAEAFAAAKPSHADAPADEYFGVQKLSALGIRMRIDALGRRYHARTIADDDLLHDAAIAEASFFAWQARYPRDSWLAPTAFHLEQLFQAVQSPAARTEATRLLHVVATTYAKTTYGHLARVRLAAGFPALTPETAVTTTPNPYASGQPTTARPAAEASSPAPSSVPGASVPPAGPAATTSASPRARA